MSMGRRITGKISHLTIKAFAAVGQLIFTTSDLEVAQNRSQISEHSEEAKKGNPWGGGKRWIKLDDKNSKGEGKWEAKGEKG